MHPYTNFWCTKFQSNRISCFHCMVTIIPWRKEEIKPTFEISYLGNAMCDLVEIWNVEYWWWRASPQQKSSGFIQAAQRYIYAKITLLFFLSIYSRVWCASFLGHTTHYHVRKWLIISNGTICYDGCLYVYIPKHMYGICKIDIFQVVKIKIQQNTSFTIIL